MVRNLLVLSEWRSVITRGVALEYLLVDKLCLRGFLYGACAEGDICSIVVKVSSSSQSLIVLHMRVYSSYRKPLDDCIIRKRLHRNEIEWEIL